MPNECWNNMTITCEENEYTQELKDLVRNELQYLDGDSYVYKKHVTMHKVGRRGIIFEVLSGWQPQYEWLEKLLHDYPHCWIKNEWYEEGGYSGVWIGYTGKDVEPKIQHFMWNDICIEGKEYLFKSEAEERQIEINMENYKENEKNQTKDAILSA